MTDLDARVAALMSKIVNHRYVPIERVDEERAEIEQALRAELQKPEQEEITDAAKYRWLVNNIGHWACITSPGTWTRKDGSSFDPKCYFTAYDSAYGGATFDEGVTAAIRASKGEKT